MKLSVHHETVYRYRQRVHLGEHTLMLRPRDSHDLRVLEAAVVTNPEGSMRWHHDVFGNSVAVVNFWEPVTEFRLVSRLSVEHIESPPLEGVVEASNHAHPSHYPEDLRRDLGETLVSHYEDPDGRLRAWTHRFVPEGAGHGGRLRTLIAMTQAIRSEFLYQPRDEHGVQTPLETLQMRSGTCRDYALLMMEAARTLGLAARFVTGYLYDHGLAADGGKMEGGGATHAWLEVYVPGAGWVEFDPTNGGVGNKNLIRVAVAREPQQATPIRGSYWGPPGSALGMDVTVEVTAG